MKILLLIALLLVLMLISINAPQEVSILSFTASIATLMVLIYTSAKNIAKNEK